MKTDNSRTAVSIDRDIAPGRPLAPWTYQNPELFELEHKAFFLNRWQLVGHVSQVADIGDFVASDIGRDNAFVMRGKDNKLRAFQNVCRHRASRILEGAGNCKGVVRCPYHGWTYHLDGALMATPQAENFPDLKHENYGLHEIELDIFHGLMFVRFAKDGPSVADQFAHTSHYFEKFGVADYEIAAETTTQIWNANWKVAWDNYLENYHIPISHPGLHRLVTEDDESVELDSGISYGIFDIREKLSNVEIERQYQQLLRRADTRVPKELRNKWVQYSFSPNLGIDMYPEMIDLFQLIPLSVDKTLVRTTYFGHPNPSSDERELRRLNLINNNAINDEDKTICERVQKGLQTHGYTPGPLAQIENTLFNFHELVREKLPVASLTSEPPRGFVAAENDKLTAMTRQQ